MTDLSVENIHVFRSDRHVLRGLGLRVEAGRCLQVTGENGAGKTTLLRVLCGLLPAESMELSWQGVRCSPHAPHYHEQLAYLSHAAPLKADLTGWENLHFALGLRGVWRAQSVQRVLEQVGAARFADRAVRSLSAGQRRRLALAWLAASQTELWLLDEPTTNLDVAGVGIVRELLLQHLQQGGIAVVATHQELDLAAPYLERLHIAKGMAKKTGLTAGSANPAAMESPSA
jgi:heme exporter protein A